MGMAAVGVAFYKYVTKFSPKNGSYFNRDRSVLSNVHACLWRYLFMHLIAVEEMTTDQLKLYHSEKVKSICLGHPEIKNDGAEIRTGPLRQGVTNAVGLAMATKHLAASCITPCSAAIRAVVSRVQAVSAEAQFQQARGSC
ncbi:hypothetical protein EJ07DRAFT_157433 [Lizonia empirigonia]|nr:hypothetical protein EJ07DRAFT_157433 [Lizonia empirigonia]